MRTRYRFRAADSAGKLKTGTVRGGSRGEAEQQLVSAGLLPLVLEACPAERLQGRAPARELAMVFRGLATLVDAGVPIDRAVAVTALSGQGSIRAALENVLGSLREGQSLAGALEYEGVVPEAIIAVLRSGELAGRLAATLEQVAGHLERDLEIRSRLLQALAYPMILCAGGIASCLVIGLVVIPRFAELLGDLDSQLPPAAAFLMTISRWLRAWWPLIPGTLAIGAVAIATGLGHSGRRRRIHQLLLALPGIGGLRRAIASERFLRGLSVALAAGTPLAPALGLARVASADAALADQWEGVTERVMEGAPLTTALASVAVMPPAAIQLIGVGEASGRLSEMAGRAALLLAGSTARQIDGIVRLLEPALIAGIGATVAFVAGALLQAVYALRPGMP